VVALGGKQTRDSLGKSGCNGDLKEGEDLGPKDEAFSKKKNQLKKGERNQFLKTHSSITKELSIGKKTPRRKTGPRISRNREESYSRGTVMRKRPSQL